MSKSKGYVDGQYLEATAKLLHEIKQRSYALMQAQPGQNLLDVGCGPATDTIPLAKLVGPTGRVTGVDSDAAMIAEANRLAEAACVSERIKHELADATSLPFNAGAYDACRSERLFQHLQEPAQALAEMARVTKVGGWVVVLDTDWGTMSIDTTETDIERRLTRVLAERTLHNGYGARQLYRLFRRQHLVEISVEMVPCLGTHYAMIRQMSRLDEVEREALSASILTADELRQWHASLEQADLDGVCFASVSMVMVAGRRI